MPGNVAVPMARVLQGRPGEGHGGLEHLLEHLSAATVVRAMSDSRGPRRPDVQRGSAAPGRGRNRPAPSLVMATLLGRFPTEVDLDTGEILEGNVRVALVEYPDGVELSAVHRRRAHGLVRESADAELHELEVQVCGHAEANRRAVERQKERAKRSSEESVRRAKSRVRRIVRYFGLRFMVTLTFPGEGVHDYDRSLRMLQDFIHDHGLTLHLGGHYVAVPELHPRGHGWHWHVLVHRRFTKGELAALWQGWTAFLGRRGMRASGGARYARVDVKDWGRAAAAAGYAAKYVGKALEDGKLGKNRRRFLASHGAVVEAQRASAKSLHEVRTIAETVPGGVVNILDSDGGRPAILWACWD